MLQKSVALTNNRDATECVEYNVGDMVESMEEIVRVYAIAKFVAELKKAKHPQNQDTKLFHFAHQFLSEVILFAGQDYQYRL